MVSSIVELPLVQLEPYLNDPKSPEALVECKKVAESLIQYGVLNLKDPRVREEYNENFLDTMEEYFEQPYDTKLQDARPEHSYQVGVTPENVEDPRCKTDPICQDIVHSMPEDSKPLSTDKPDCKWRFFWKMGEGKDDSKFEKMDPVIPQAFPNWSQTMNTWGGLMKSAVSTITEMLAVGLDLPADAFLKYTKYGPHLLAPTGSDLGKNGQLDTVLAGFHYDLNFLTIHGKSRYPGLNIWARNSPLKIAVKVPQGCLLVQAGKELEYLTGGKILAGYHEVIVNDNTVKAIEKAKAENRSVWRISSTFFLHIGLDEQLEPILPENHDSANPQFQHIQTKYPKVLTGDYIANELSGINLKH